MYINRWIVKLFYSCIMNNASAKKRNEPPVLLRPWESHHIYADWKISDDSTYDSVYTILYSMRTNYNDRCCQEQRAWSRGRDDRRVTKRHEETFGVMYMFIILMMPITSKYNMDSLKLFILKRYSFFFWKLSIKKDNKYPHLVHILPQCCTSPPLWTILQNIPLYSHVYTSPSPWVDFDCW